MFAGTGGPAPLCGAGPARPRYVMERECLLRTLPLADARAGRRRLVRESARVERRGALLVVTGIAP